MKPTRRERWEKLGIIVPSGDPDELFDKLEAEIVRLRRLGVIDEQALQAVVASGRCKLCGARLSNPLGHRVEACEVARALAKGTP